MSPPREFPVSSTFFAKKKLSRWLVDTHSLNTFPSFRLVILVTTAYLSVRMERETHGVKSLMNARAEIPRDF
jgi:hypothetical protein